MTPRSRRCRVALLGVAGAVLSVVFLAVMLDLGLVVSEPELAPTAGLLAVLERVTHSRD